MDVIRVSSKGQIVIPEAIRNKMRIKEGSRLVLVEKGDMLILKKEDDVVRGFDVEDRREDVGWMLVAEQSLKKIWDNPIDDKIWNKYL